MIALLYASVSRLTREQEDREIASIVKTSMIRNEQSDITGALVYTGGNFAQLLEGPERSVTDLMASIRRDDRHENVTDLFIRPTSERLFGNWSLAYRGRSAFMGKHLIAALSARSEAARSAAADDIVLIMREFVLGSPSSTDKHDNGDLP